MKNNYGHWISLAEQYLKTSKLIIEQIIEHDNKWFIIDDKPIAWDDYSEKTKWSDFNTLVPAIFLLLHGLELLIKGLVIYLGYSIKPIHDISKMLDLLNNDSRINRDLIKLLEGYIGTSPSNPIMKEFIKINNHVKTERVHIVMRYPEDKGETDFSPFRYQQDNLISELKIIILEIDKIYCESLSIIRSS